MMWATAYAEWPSRFGLAAVRLLLCGQAAGANHQTTPMTSASAASTEAKIDRFPLGAALAKAGLMTE